ncbi:MFS transporter [Protaetiibacter intestinalis]|uniref:MFS transporter n=1 Tax=Protaetiibacter intestinalis TaxID=2419774 RepID=A0A387B6I1_9MICO|nr:MFS transporter [Protaetiibacter intestinalis]AYF99262.1 MFS transporter [Protaetiibacter intestinalis]
MTTSNAGAAAAEAPQDSTRRVAARAALAGGVGTFIEHYEYGLYGFIAGIVIGPLFFPSEDPAVGLLASFAALAVGYVARPFGGIVLGAASDRYGRRPVLVFTLLLIGVATAAIGLLPTYAAIGIWAPILLVLMRLIQGFGAGAELAGAITIINESAVRKRKAALSAVAMAAVGLGGISANLLTTLLGSTISPEAFLEWGWRIPFVLGAVLTVVGLMLRRTMHESPEFERVKAERAAGLIPPAKLNPFVAMGRAVKASPRNWISAFLLPSGFNVTGFIVAAYSISYVVGVRQLPLNQALQMSLIAISVGLVALLLFGLLGDRIGTKRVMYISIVGGVLFAFPYVAILAFGDIGMIALGSVVMYIFGWSAGAAAHTVVMPALFKTEYRASGLFSARELQGAVVAGPSALIAAALVVASGGQPWLVGAYIVAGHLVSLIGMLVGRPFLGATELESTPSLRGWNPRD